MSYYRSPNYLYDIFDPATGELIAKEQPQKGYTADSRYPYIQIKTDVKTGSVTVRNTKNGAEYTYTAEPSCLIYGVPNPTGEYLIFDYQKVNIVGEDEQGAIYETPIADNRRYTNTLALLNMKTGKVTALKDKNAPLYSGRVWVDEHRILVSYSTGGTDATSLMENWENTLLSLDDFG